MQQPAGSCALSVVAQVRTRYQVCNELALHSASFPDSSLAGLARAFVSSVSCIGPPCGHACHTLGKKVRCRAVGCSGWWLKDNASWDRARLDLGVGSCLSLRICVVVVDTVVQVETVASAEPPRWLKRLGRPGPRH